MPKKLYKLYVREHIVLKPRIINIRANVMSTGRRVAPKGTLI